MANFVKHTNCDSCGSSDGKAVYDDASSHCFNDLTILNIAGQDSKNYRLVSCRCSICCDVANYRLSDVKSGKVKRCKACNKDRKVKKTECISCSQIFEQRKMVNSKRAKGYICKECYSTMVKAKCKVCEVIVNTENGNHSGYCEVHWNLHRIAYNLMSASKHRARKNGMNHDLDIDWIKTRLDFCEVTGILFEFRDVKVKQSTGNYTNRSPFTPSIDKIDPAKGYTKDNCRIVIWWYNLSKALWTDYTVIDIVTQWVKNKEL